MVQSIDVSSMRLKLMGLKKSKDGTGMSFLMFEAARSKLPIISWANGSDLIILRDAGHSVAKMKCGEMVTSNLNYFHNNTIFCQRRSFCHMIFKDSNIWENPQAKAISGFRSRWHHRRVVISAYSQTKLKYQTAKMC